MRIQKRATSDLVIHFPTDKWRQAYMIWLAHQSENTRDAYHRAWVYFVDVFPDVPMDQIVRDHVVIFHNMLVEKYSNATVNQRISALRSFFNFAIDSKLISENPVQGNLYEPVQKFGKMLTLDVQNGEHIDLLKGIDKSTKKGVRDYAITLFMIVTGLRVSEVCALDVKDLAGNRLEYTYKGNREEVVNIPEYVLSTIQDYHNLRPNLTPTSPLFASIRERRLTRQKLTDMVTQRATDENLPPITGHGLRHAMGHLITLRTKDPRAVKAGMRHARIDTAMVYYDQVLNGANQLVSDLSDLIQKELE